MYTTYSQDKSKVQVLLQIIKATEQVMLNIYNNRSVPQVSTCTLMCVPGV